MLSIYLQDVVKNGAIDEKYVFENSTTNSTTPSMSSLSMPAMSPITPNSSGSLSGSISITDDADKKQTQKAANLFHFLLEEENFPALISTYENISQNQGGIQNVDFDIIPQFPSCYSTFFNKNNLDCGIVYARDANNSIVVLYEDLNTPEKLVNFFSEPVQIDGEKAINLISNWYLTEEATKKHPVVLALDRQKLVVLYVPFTDALDSSEQSLFYEIKKYLQNQRYPILIYDECMKASGWLRNMFKDYSTKQQIVLKTNNTKFSSRQKTWTADIRVEQQFDTVRYFLDVSPVEFKLYAAVVYFEYKNVRANFTHAKKYITSTVSTEYIGQNHKQRTHLETHT